MFYLAGIAAAFWILKKYNKLSFSILKKYLLFLKKKVLLIYKYRPSLYLAKLSSIYRGYLGHILGSEYLSSKGTDALDFLFLKSLKAS
jgi:hypothetical protein